jgi:hypothetical protein
MSLMNPIEGGSIMKKRRIVMFSALSLMLVLVVLFMSQRPGCSAVPPLHAIEMKNGTTVEGALMKLQDCAYLVQAEKECYLLMFDDITRIDGEKVKAAELPVTDRVPRLFETYEKISPQGEITLHSTHFSSNNGPKMLSRLDWGLAPHELSQLETYRVVDEFANELPIQIEDHPSGQGKRLRVVLPRPVLPGETLQFTTIYQQKDGVRRDGDDWVYRHRGDYPDDRLVTRSVQLPAGAEIISVSPEPLHQVTSQEGTLVIWRRYFVKGEVMPWEIRYKV